MGFLSVLSYAHKLVEERLRPGDTAVDATVGNGVDTLFLAKAVGAFGRVYGFDIQERALAGTRQRLVETDERLSAAVTLVHASHDRMNEAVDPGRHGSVGAVMFNLGYLPGGDPSTITTPLSTLPALERALSLLRKGGILTIVVYPGHEGGGEEADAVQAWVEALPQQDYQAMSYRFVNRLNRPPYLIAVEKR